MSETKKMVLFAIIAVALATISQVFITKGKPTSLLGGSGVSYGSNSAGQGQTETVKNGSVALDVNALSGGSDGTFVTFQRTVTTSTTPVQLQSVTTTIDAGVAVRIRPLTSNIGNITIGATSASSSSSNTDFYALGPSSTEFIFYPSDLQNVWIDATVSGEGVYVLYET